MRVILIFVDGVGSGNRDLSTNPCLHPSIQSFNQTNGILPSAGVRTSLDAVLGVSGLPQSATGQTSIYTGVNAAKLIGQHLTGFPNNPLRHQLANNSIFTGLTQKGKRCIFLNAFRPLFFTTPEVFRNMKMSATTEMNRQAGLNFCNLDDIRSDRALYHDYTNTDLRAYGFGLPTFDANRAADVIIRRSGEHDLVLYEYFSTDFAGHAMDYDRALEELKKIDALIISLVAKINLQTTSLVVCSDHGNIEDITQKSHTTNPAFFAYWGRDAEFVEILKDLTDVRPFIERIICE